uniref:Uncharacterized protein n=1 Tax=Oryza meridionalis TaxID=40149 RepID=A0A0E0CWW8_9ORYZ
MGRWASPKTRGVGGKPYRNDSSHKDATRIKAGIPSDDEGDVDREDVPFSEKEEAAMNRIHAEAMAKKAAASAAIDPAPAPAVVPAAIFPVPAVIAPVPADVPAAIAPVPPAIAPGP